MQDLFYIRIGKIEPLALLTGVAECFMQLHLKLQHVVSGDDAYCFNGKRRCCLDTCQACLGRHTKANLVASRRANNIDISRAAKQLTRAGRVGAARALDALAYSVCVVALLTAVFVSVGLPRIKAKIGQWFDSLTQRATLFSARLPFLTSGQTGTFAVSSGAMSTIPFAVIPAHANSAPRGNPAFAIRVSVKELRGFGKQNGATPARFVWYSFRHLGLLTGLGHATAVDAARGFLMPNYTISPAFLLVNKTS